MRQPGSPGPALHHHRLGGLPGDVGGDLRLQLALQVNLVNLQYVLAGLILLGLNGARFASGILMSRLSLTAGFMALAAGIVRHFAGELTIISGAITAVGCVILAYGLTLNQESPSDQR